MTSFRVAAKSCLVLAAASFNLVPLVLDQLVRNLAWQSHVIC